MSHKQTKPLRIFWLSWIGVTMMGLLAACAPKTPNFVYTQSPTWEGNSDIYLYALNSTTAVPLATSPDPEVPCGATSDGRIVFTRKTPQGGDIYVVKADGTGLSPVIATPSLDERCVYVASNNEIFYELRASRLSVDEIWMSAALNSGGWSGQIVNYPQGDQEFLAMAPDGHIIFSRQNPIVEGGHDLVSIFVYGGFVGPPVVLSQFNPGHPEATFLGITHDNHVIFGQPDQFGTGMFALFSAKTDGTSPAVIASNPPDNDFFCAITYNNRVVYTERITDVATRQPEWGDIFIVGADGNGRIKLNQSPPWFNDTCKGITGDRVIFSRRIGSWTGGDQNELFSIDSNGNSPPIMLDSAPGNGTNEFESVTTWSRVLYTTQSCSTTGALICAISLSSIRSDGTQRVTLAGPAVGGARVEGVTLYDNVMISQAPVNGSYPNLFIVNSAGGTPLQIAPAPAFQFLDFIYYK